MLKTLTDDSVQFRSPRPDICAGTFLVPHISAVLGMVLRALTDDPAQLPSLRPDH